MSLARTRRSCACRDRATTTTSGSSASAPPTAGIGLYHLAWQVDTIDELAQAQVTLAELGALVGESSHGATKSLYGQDPDGHEFEVQWMLPRAGWGEFESSAPIEPLDLRGELQTWTGVRTADELRPIEPTS